MKESKLEQKNPDSTYQPTKEELEADVSIPNATPDELLMAAINFNPRKNS